MDNSTKKAKTVDEYLNEVSYHDLKNYVPSPFSIKFMNFVKMVNAGKADIQTSPPVHYKMIDGLITPHKRIANLCSRGLAKTSLYGEFLILYIAVFNTLPNFGLVDVIMYIADTMENGAKNFRNNVEARYNASDVLKQLIPTVKFTDKELVFTNKEGVTTWVILFGAASGVRGVKRNGNRPVLAILDDLVSDEAANSPTQLEKIKMTIYNETIAALNSKRSKIIFNGTPFNKNDPLYEAIESGAWHSNVYPVCSEFPCEREDFDGAWEERFSYDFIMDTYQTFVKSGRVKAFKQELMLRIASAEDRMIQDSDWNWFNAEDLLKQKYRYNFVITTDFATSDKVKADYTTIGVWALDYKGNRYLVDGVIGRLLMNQTFDKLFDLIAKYEPLGVGIETAGQQGAFIALLREEMHRRAIYFNIVSAKGKTQPGIPAQTNKMNRFRLSVPFFKQGMFYLPSDKKESILVQEILEEVSLVTIDGIKSKNDDAIDMISQLDQIHLPLPDEQQNNLSVDPYSNKSSDFTEPFSDSDYLNGESNYTNYLA